MPLKVAWSKELGLSVLGHKRGWTTDHASSTPSSPQVQPADEGREHQKGEAESCGPSPPAPLLGPSESSSVTGRSHEELQASGKQGPLAPEPGAFPERHLCFQLGNIFP